MIIKNRKIDNNNPPLIVAEVSANHQNSLNTIYKILNAAAKIGLEAVKFQTFDLDEMTINSRKSDFLIKKKIDNKQWQNKSLYNLYKKVQLPFSWHKKIFKRAKQLGLICFSSVFDEKSLILLEKLNCPAYKIASLESLHFPLIEKVIMTKKPIIISTGTLEIGEIKELVNFVRKKKCSNFAILHCITKYPASAKDINLNKIKYYKKKFKCLVGFSDHTNDIGSSIGAAAFGANIIEKHFKLSNSSKTLDSLFSIDPQKMSNLIIQTKIAWESVGRINTNPDKTDKLYKFYRRSIYAVQDIKKNELLNKNNIKIIRPGNGLEPKYFNRILGKKTRQNISRGSPIKLSKIFI